MEEIKVIRAKTLKPKPEDESKLVFGRTFTDHMFTMEYSSAKGWHNPTVKPYAPLELDPDPQWAVRAELEEVKNEKEEE